jgi:hypothetical protein
MTRSALLAAAAIFACALASPAMAQEVIEDPGYCAQYYPNANCQNLGPGNPYTGDDRRLNGGQNHGRDRRGGERWNDRSGFRPGDAAAGAVGTANPTAPDDAHARRNGFVCTPGTWFRGEDGRRHICQ